VGGTEQSNQRPLRRGEQARFAPGRNDQQSPDPAEISDKKKIKTPHQRARGPRRLKRINQVVRCEFLVAQPVPRRVFQQEQPGSQRHERAEEVAGLPQPAFTDQKPEQKQARGDDACFSYQHEKRANACSGCIALPQEQN
jgi:hypothetical protein